MDILRWTGRNIEEMEKFCRAPLSLLYPSRLILDTTEGLMTANKGDWILRREHGMTIATTHSLERTAPKGGPFIGRCVLCGQPNLPMSAAQEWCPNPINGTQDDALINAIFPAPGGE
jgi:hypothetical protein